jgi:hypothetical protein
MGYGSDTGRASNMFTKIKYFGIQFVVLVVDLFHFVTNT